MDIEPKGDWGWALIAFAGGVTKALSRFLKSGLRMSWVEFFRIIMFGMVAIFAGWLGHEAFMHIKPEWATFMAGLFGWLGADGVKWFVEQFLKKAETVPPTHPRREKHGPKND